MGRSLVPSLMLCFPLSRKEEEEEEEEGNRLSECEERDENERKKRVDVERLKTEDHSQFSRKDQSNSSLDVPRGDGGVSVLIGENGSLGRR